MEVGVDVAAAAVLIVRGVWAVSVYGGSSL